MTSVLEAILMAVAGVGSILGLWGSYSAVRKTDELMRARARELARYRVLLSRAQKLPPEDAQVVLRIVERMIANRRDVERLPSDVQHDVRAVERCDGEDEAHGEHAEDDEHGERAASVP